MLKMVVSLQFFALDALRAIRELSQRRIPVLAWQTADPAHVVRNFGPKDKGGLGDMKPIIYGIAADSGISIAEAAEKVRAIFPEEGLLCNHPRRSTSSAFQVSSLPWENFHPCMIMSTCLKMYAGSHFLVTAHS
jgi:hypothetical protein